jgi:hypothetical protein
MLTEKNNTIRISFCIVCMNRLHHLQQTFIKNIHDNQDYPDLEFVLLDYNSRDGMDLWVKENLQEYIADGRLTYYKTFEPQVFSHSHSKNLAFRLAGGDIVCNINADHYTGKGFGRYVNDSFNIDPNIVLTTIDSHKTTKNYHPSKDVFGKVCVKKSDFLKIKGYDEQMNNYGFEDYDFVNRLEMSTVKRTFIDDFSFLEFIHHDDEERYSMNNGDEKIHSIYVQHHTPSLSKIIILYKDHCFEMGYLINNSSADAHNYMYAFRPRQFQYQINGNEAQWVKGQWQEDTSEHSIVFNEQPGNSFEMKQLNSNGHWLLKNALNDQSFHRLSHEGVGDYVVRISHTFRNRVIMEENLKEKRIEVNPTGFGNALVFKNFNMDQPLHLI